MKKSAEVEAEFKEKFDALLAEYKAEITIEDISTGFYNDEKLCIYIPTVWDGDNPIAESATIYFNI